jgi:hypothetical protein
LRYRAHAFIASLVTVSVVVALVSVDIDHDNPDKTATFCPELRLRLKCHFAVEVPTVKNAGQSVPEGKRM